MDTLGTPPGLASAPHPSTSHQNIETRNRARIVVSMSNVLGVGGIGAMFFLVLWVGIQNRDWSLCIVIMVLGGTSAVIGTIMGHWTGHAGPHHIESPGDSAHRNLVSGAHRVTHKLSFFILAIFFSLASRPALVKPTSIL